MPRVRLSPILGGGGQEKNIRPGTFNVSGIVGFASAAEIAQNEYPDENIRFKVWSKYMLDKF